MNGSPNRTTCLMFGAQVGTAYLVAGTFVQGMEQERKR